MGDNATASEGSKSKSSESTKSNSKDKSKSASKSTSVDRSPSVPPAKGHGDASNTPDALGIDRMKVQRRKQAERTLGPATVDRKESAGDLDLGSSGLAEQARSVAENVSIDRSTDDSGGGNTVSIDREEAGTSTASGGASGGSASGGSVGSSSVRGSGGSTASSSTGSSGGPSDLVQSVVSSGGGALEPSVRGEMESKLGADFSDVRVHTGPEANKAAEAIDAKAFTVGNHVAFNSGAYDASSPEGKHTIAHELAHVQQQADQARLLVQRVRKWVGRGP